MVPALLEVASPVLSRHLTVGCSTGYMSDERGDWQALIARCAATSTAAVELSALSEPELPALVDMLAARPSMPFHYVSVHAPSKQLMSGEHERVALLERLPPGVRAIVVHPDVLIDPEPWQRLGRRLVIENMDMRKETGRTADDLQPMFEALPLAGLCLDVAHAADVDPTMVAADAILDRFAERLRHVHLSSLDSSGHHVSLTPDDEARFSALLGRCRDVPWILEAPPA